MNFLSALALVNNGVREILPFIRYFAQFIDFEFAAIKSQDRGYGVVCAATWFVSSFIFSSLSYRPDRIMPAAMVPRPWDFPVPEVPNAEASNGDPNLSQSGIITPSGPLPKPAISITDIVANNNPAPTLTPTPTSPPKPTAPINV